MRGWDLGIAVAVAVASVLVAQVVAVPVAADPGPELDCENASNAFRVAATEGQDTVVRWCTGSDDAAFGEGVVAYAEIGGGGAGDDVILYAGTPRLIDYETLLHELGHTAGYGHEWDSVMAIGNPEDRRSAAIDDRTWSIASRYEGFRPVDWSGASAVRHLQYLACEFRRGRLSADGLRYALLQFREGTDRDVYFRAGFDQWGGFADDHPTLLEGRYTFYGKPVVRDREWAGDFEAVALPATDGPPRLVGSFLEAWLLSGPATGATCS